jgi:hypothetical protein
VVPEEQMYDVEKEMALIRISNFKEANSEVPIPSTEGVSDDTFNPEKLSSKVQLIIPKIDETR